MRSVPLRQNHLVDAPEVLVSIEHGDLRAGVLRDRNGTCWLSCSLQRASGPRLDDTRPRSRGLSEDRTLIGGLLPAGAVRAEVVDARGERHVAAVGDGAWVAVLAQPIDGRATPVCFRDEHGSAVAPALPAGWPRSAVEDAAQRCPACGECGWDEALPTDDSRGMRGTAGGGMEPTPIVVCRFCGYEESVGAWMTMVSASPRADADEDEVARRTRAAMRERRRRRSAMLTEIDFPIYAPQGWEVTLAGWGGGERVERVSVAHHDMGAGSDRMLRVETVRSEECARSEQALAQAEMEQLLHRRPRSQGVGRAEAERAMAERSEAARAIALHALQRERRLRAAKAARSRCDLIVDGLARSFTLLRSGDRWSAAACGPGLTIVLAAIDVDPASLRLAPLESPEEALGADSWPTPR